MRTIALFIIIYIYISYLPSRPLLPDPHLLPGKVIPLVQTTTPAESDSAQLPPNPDTRRRRHARDQEPALEPAIDEPGLKRALERITDRLPHLPRQVAPQQQRRADHVRGRDLADEQRQVGLGLVQQPGGPLGEQPERLEDRVGAGGQDDARQEERDLAGPGHLVKLGVPVAGEQAQEPVDRVRGREGRGRVVGAPEGRQHGGQDAVDAVQAEDVLRDGEELAHEGPVAGVRGAPAAEQ